MRICEEIRGDVIILTLRGTLMSGPEVAPFRDYVRRLAVGGLVKVVVNFSKIKWMGSAMLGALMGSARELRRAGGDLRLSGTERIHSILMVTHLGRVCRIFETVDRAVASFRVQPFAPAGLLPVR